MTLVYNQLRKGKGRRPEPPGYDSERARAAALLKKWAAGKRSADGKTPEKLIYPLDHAYTPAELRFETLKGADAAKADLLTAAAPQAGCDLHLALLSIEESGITEYAADFNPRRGRWSDEDEFEAGEVCDRYEHLSEWRRPDGVAPTLGSLPIEDKEICQPDALKDMVPDEEHFHEATGNEGASFERTYRRAALVLWPRERIYAILNQAGLSVTLPYLQDLIERWETSGNAKSVLSHQAEELAGHMLSTWPMSTWRSTDDDGPREAARMLALLTRLGAAEHIDAFVAATIAGGHHGKSDNEAIR